MPSHAVMLSNCIPVRIFAALLVFAVTLVRAAPLSNVTINLKSFTSHNPSEQNCLFFTFSPPSASANTVLITPSPLLPPGYDCDNCGFARVTTSITTQPLDAQFSFVNASLSTAFVSGLVLQLKTSAFPPYPVLSSCTICLVPYTPSLPSGSHTIILSTHNSSLLPPSLLACPNSSTPCPLPVQPFSAAAPIDLAAAAPLHIPPTAYFHPNSMRAASARTILATFPRTSLPPNASFTAVSSGADFGCGIASNETQCSAGSSNVYCWGSYNLNSKWYPTQIPLPPAAYGVSVCAGYDHACVVTQGGLVYCWGRNIENQCGSNVSAYVPAAEPLLVPGVAHAKVVKCGLYSTCASTGAGAQHKLVCWGNKLGSRAQGYPSINSSIVWPSPTVFPLYNDKPLKEGDDSFSIGGFSGCAVLAANSSSSILWCWGDIRFMWPRWNNNPPYSSSVMPIPNTSGSDIKAVAVGSQHACAIDHTVGGAYCWGSNDFCQLGDNTSACSEYLPYRRREEPVRVQGQLGKKLASVTVGNRHTCAITINKELYCWGDNRNGYLGNLNASFTISAAPVLVTLNASALSVSTASFTFFPATCAVADTSPKTLFCWGNGQYGAVGIGPLKPARIIVREPALVAQVASVGSVSVTTRANASTWASGLGVFETKSRILKGSDVLVIVLNDSAAELDFESSAFVSDSRQDTYVDVALSINCAVASGSVSISPRVPCSQRTSCTSCEPGFSSNDCKWCTSDPYNPAVGGVCAAECSSRQYTISSIASCAASARPTPPSYPPYAPPEISCDGRACGWPDSPDNVAAAGIAAFILCFIVSLIQPYIAVLFEARALIQTKIEAFPAAQMLASNAQCNSSFQARAAELDQHVDASARVPTYFELMCPVALQNCKRSHSTSVSNSVSIEMLARNVQQHPYALTMDQLPPAVHASGYIEADFEGPWGSSSPKQRLKVVWRRFIPVYLIIFGVYFATAYVFFKYVVYDNDGHVKPMKGTCFNLEDMQKNICVFAAGQGAYGLIAVGQAAVGLVVLAQGGVGIILAVGQGALSLGFSIGQVASGCFIEACQIGVGLIHIKRCMLGLRAFAWISAPLHMLETSFLATCICNNRRTAPRNQRAANEAEAAAVAAAIAAFAAAGADAGVAGQGVAQAPAAPASFLRAPRRAVLRVNPGLEQV